MKLIVFSDLHISHKMIDEEVLDNLFIDISSHVTNDSIICFTGDLFHKKVELHDTPSQQAVALFRKIDNLNIPTIVVEGTFSHDYQYIDTFKKIGLKNFTFIQHVTELLNFKNNINETLDILCIPEEYVENQVEYYKDTVYNKKKVYDLVLMHGTFIDVLFHNVNIEAETLRKAPKFDSKDFSRHLLTLSGHIHKHQVLGKKKNVIYVGSYSNMNFGEDKSNNLIVVDIDKENKKFQFKLIENTKSHQFIEETIKEDITYDEFQSQYIDKFKNKHCRTHYKIKYDGLDETIKHILKTMRKDNYIKSLSIQSKILEEVQSLRNVEEENYSSIYTGKIEDQIQLFIKTYLNKDLNTDKISQILKN